MVSDVTQLEEPGSRVVIDVRFGRFYLGLSAGVRASISLRTAALHPCIRSNSNVRFGVYSWQGGSDNMGVRDHEMYVCKVYFD